MSSRIERDEDDDFQAILDFYARNWKLLLKNLLCWPDEKIENWVKARLCQWKKHKGLAAHQTPAYYVCFEMFPEYAKEAFGSRLSSITRKVESALLDGETSVEGFSASDWAAARERVNYFLSHCKPSLHLPATPE